ncbi:MAG: cellulase family glycosylhydrolase [Lachnospiraceae bacterium]|jgi:endoglucanase|nr:cellulase family glycosylhydrolase [Lachnospiraceae bacterium]
MRIWIKLSTLLILSAVLTGCGPKSPEASAAVTSDPTAFSPETLPAGSGFDAIFAGTAGKETSHPPVSGTLSAALPSVSGALRVDNTRLVDENGQAVQLKGISTHGLAWFPDYINEACFRQLREEWNANVIRLAMYTAEYGGYCTGGDQDALKELIHNGVEYATAQDMYVIIDWHILSDSNPNTYLAQAKDFFGEMSELYAGHNNVLYEICNEPNGGTQWSEIKSYAEEVISVIRSHDQNGIIIVGTPNWSQYVDQAAADPITGYGNIMYALHFYAATHKESLRNTMAAAVDAGLPVFVTEYGICDASGNGTIDEHQANQWVTAMNDYGVSYVAWNLSNKNETSAILNQNCSKTSDFTDSDLSASGRWLHAMLTGQSSDPGAPDPEAPGEGDSPVQKPESVTNTPAPNHASQEQEPPADVSDTDKTLSFSARLINSWESEGKTFYQYELTLQNNSGADCTGWSIEVLFSEAVSLSDSWNGNFTVSDSKLQITNKDYNGSISSGGSAGNIGFIVSGSSQMNILNGENTD